MGACVTAMKRQQHVGVYAGDTECYTAMAPVFNKVINSYHNLKVEENKAEEETYKKVKLPKIPNAKAVVSTRIRTARNLKSLPFTVNMTKAQRLKLESTMEKVFKTFTGTLEGKYYPMVGMKEEVRKDLVDKHYIYINDEKYHKDTGVFIIWVGEEDQLRIMAM